MGRVQFWLCLATVLLSHGGQTSTAWGLLSTPRWLWKRIAHRIQWRGPSQKPTVLPTGSGSRPRFATEKGKLHSFPTNTSTDEIHRYFMNLTLHEAARVGRENQEVPIAAMVVQAVESAELAAAGAKGNKELAGSEGRSFRIIGFAGNQVEALHDAAAHAEILALRQAGESLENWRLLNTTLFCTLEPCPMCLSAILAFRVSTLVYGARDFRLGAVESYVRLLEWQHPMHNLTTVVGGMGANASATLLRDFFRARRKTRAARKPEEGR